MKRRLPLVLFAVLLLATMSYSEEPESQTISFHGIKLHALIVGPEDGRPVLLLHGARFHSGTWREIGTYRKLAENGFRALGLDLPGYGRSEALDVSAEKLLAELLPVLGLDKPVVVSPSLSGAYTFPLLLNHPELVSGFVGVAPAGINRYEAQLERIRIPTLILWGENDQIIPLSLGERLAEKVEGSKLVVLEGARHPCYFDRPDEFHQALLEFLSGLAR